MNELKIGTYTIPEGCTLVRRGNKVVIKQKTGRHRPACDYRCCDCKHMVQGHWRINQWYLSNVCEMRPGTREGLFRAVKPLGGKDCKFFEKDDKKTIVD